jgi:hypothetical protein
MYAGANMGHPSREEGFVLCSNHSAANDKGERTRISCRAALDKTPCAPFFKERRMMFANVTNFYRKSGVAQ